jgi:hypothetical protein
MFECFFYIKRRKPGVIPSDDFFGEQCDAFQFLEKGNDITCGKNCCVQIQQSFPLLMQESLPKSLCWRAVHFVPMPQMPTFFHTAPCATTKHFLGTVQPSVKVHKMGKICWMEHSICVDPTLDPREKCCLGLTDPSIGSGWTQQSIE